MIITITLFYYYHYYYYYYYCYYYYYTSNSHAITTQNLYSWILIQYKKDITKKYLIYK